MGQTSLSERLRAVEAEISAGRTDRALSLAQELQAQYPRALVVLRVLGEVYLALRKPREALGALDRVLAGNPEDARACCARAIVQQIQGDSSAALAWYRRACDISPDDQLLRSAYRELASHLGRPPYEPTRMGLARLYLRGDLFAHAIREWESLLAEQPDALEAQLGLAETLWRAGSFHAAEERCARILLNAPSCVKALLILAVIHYDAGRDDETRRLIQRAAEYDPEQRIGLALLADRFAAGDTALQTLLIGDRPLRGANGASRPLSPSHSRPTGAPPIPSSAAETGTGPAMPLTITSGPAMPPPGARQPATRDFRTMFAETEYMLWGRETEELPRLPRQSQPAASADATAGGPAPRAQFTAGGPDHATGFVPPVLRDQGFNLEETEARAAINFVNWLQAQGARVHGVTGPLPPNTGALPPPASRVTRVRMDQTSAPAAATGPLPNGDRVTGPLPTGPLPTSDALRAMFAELGETQSPRVVEGAIVPTGEVVAPQSPHPESSSGASPELPGWSDSQADATDWGFDAALASGGGAFADQPPAAAADSALRAAGTLEELERGLASSGFRQFDLQSGQLAALAAAHAAPADSSVHALDGLEALTALEGLDEPAAGEVSTDVLAGHMRHPEEPSAPTRAEPAPDDYPARLDHARGQRAAGALDAALVHYRAVLKNAPDLLNEVVGDLRESLADTPDHPEIHRLLGDARIRQGDYLSALESYNRAVALTNAHED